MYFIAVPECLTLISSFRKVKNRNQIFAPVGFNTQKYKVPPLATPFLLVDVISDKAYSLVTAQQLYQIC